MKINAICNYNISTKLQQNNRKKNKCVAFMGGIKNNNALDVVDIFKNLVEIPSPSLKEINVANWIIDFCKNNKICANFDNYKNVKINIPATDKAKKTLLFSAHMDVIGDDSPVNIITEGDFIKTDGKRTLGADDKAGIAVALKLAKEIVDNNVKHGGIEMLFTRDEELGFSGIKNVDFNNISSKYALVLDEATLGKFDNSGAGYTTANLSLKTFYGGHSGMDIKDKNRINAAKAISEMISEIPQGMYYEDKDGAITSINVGTIIAGNIQNSAKLISEQKINSADYLEYFMKNAETNVINTRAEAALSIRSSNEKREQELRQLLIRIVENFNQKNKGLAVATINFEELTPIFEKVEDSTMENIYKEACRTIGLNPSIGTFPASAETHILATKRNKNNEPIIPALLGIADIYNMHSFLEKINIKSLEKGYELIKEMFLKFNS